MILVTLEFQPSELYLLKKVPFHATLSKGFARDGRIVFLYIIAVYIMSRKGMNNYYYL